MNDEKIRQIALYGKGGIGKSTIASNVSAALAEKSIKVFQIGCSPKVDSTAFLLGGDIIERDILTYLRGGTGKDDLQQCIKEGYLGVLCAESGGPEPATGCAGKGVAYALEVIEKTRLLDELEVEFVLYDVIGDVVCGGFAQPMRSGYAREIYIVTSGELMSLYSANNICIAICELGQLKDASVRLGGLINNMRGVEKEEELVDEFARKLSVPVLAHIPRSHLVQEAEAEGGTVLEKRPKSHEATLYRQLAQNILQNPHRLMPTPMELEDIVDLLRCYQAID